MSKPHICPVCNGNGKRFSEGSTAKIQYEQCPACLGACVLWEPPHIVELGAPQPFIPFTSYEPNTCTGMWEWREKDAAQYQVSYKHIFTSVL